MLYIQWLKQKVISSSQEDKEKSRIWLIKLMNKGLFIDIISDGELDYHECSFNHQDVSGSSLAGSVYLKGIVISLQNAPNFASDYIQLKYSEDSKLHEEVEILNLTELTHAKKLRPRYVPSPNHTPDGLGIYRGSRGTPMDLGDEVAQSVLDEAIANVDSIMVTIRKNFMNSNEIMLVVFMVIL